MGIYGTLFGTFAKIGLFTIGGGYAMIPLIEAEVVDKRKWLERQELLDVMAIAQSIPGIFAINTAIFVGYKVKGLRGAIGTTLGCVMPSFVIILAIALFFTQIKDNVWVEKAFKGLRPAVVALIAAPCYKMARSAGLGWKTLWIPVVVACGIWLGGLSPLYFIGAALIVGAAYGTYRYRKLKGGAE